MLEWKINQSEVLIGFLDDMHHFFYQASTEVLSMILKMADEWSHISCILEREEEEFQAVMTAEVGATFLCTTKLDKIEFLVYLLMLILLSCIEKWKSQNFELDLFLCVFNLCVDRLLLHFPRGWIPVWE